MFCKTTHGDVPSYHFDMLPHTVGDRNDYNSCSAHKIDVPFTMLACYRRSLFSVVIQEWNNVTYDIMMASSINNFKIAILKRKGAKHAISVWTKMAQYPPRKY